MFYPETTTADGRLGITSPTAGTIFVAPVGSVIHRSIHEHVISDIPEIDRVFYTLANKVYHLEQNLVTGDFTLRDLADSEYNSGALPESDPSFDSHYDRALHARIVTNSSNVAQITPLRNAASLFAQEEVTFPSGSNSNNQSLTGGRQFDWARTPKVLSSATARINNGSMPDNDVGISTREVTRYEVTETWVVDYVDTFRVSYLAVA